MKNNWKPIISVVVIGIFSVYTVESTLDMWTPYQKKLDLLKKVMRQDHLWKAIYGQPVYVSLDRMYHRRIIETELLDNTLHHYKHGEEGGNRDACAAGDPIKPENFLVKLFEGRYVIGSLLDMGLQVLQKSFKCMVYKDFIHMLTLIRNEITRNLVQKGTIKWSKRTKVVVADVVILMSALQFTDVLLLGVIKFLGLFDRKDSEQALRKFEVAPYLDSVITEMLQYLPCNCIKAPKSVQEVAKELNVTTLTDLYDHSMAKNIPQKTFKMLFSSAMEKIKEHYSHILLDAGMTKKSWYEILLIQTKPGDKDFIQISI